MEHNPQPSGYFDGSGAEKMAVGPNEYQGQNGAMFSPQDQYHQQQQAYHQGATPSHYAPPGSSTGAPPAKRNGTIMGMARGAFIAVLLLMLLLVGLVVGLGAGLGVTQNKLHDAKADLAAAKSSATSPSETVYVTMNGPASATPTASAVSDPYSCLNATANANGTSYTASSAGGSKADFTVHCGLDYGSDEGATDLKTSQTKTMAACMDDCAGLRDCEGAGWGSFPDDKDGLHNCYMKGNLTKGHSADAGWTFAVLSRLST